jgi:hypothetical protein
MSLNYTFSCIIQSELQVLVTHCHQGVCNVSSGFGICCNFELHRGKDKVGEGLAEIRLLFI